MAESRDVQEIAGRPPGGLARWLPGLRFLVGYDVESLGRDLLSGVFVAVLLVPQGMAYALLAGLPERVGLYASLGPALLYAFLGTSRFLSLGPVALVSLLTADALATAGVSGEAAVGHALVLAGIVGLSLTLAGLARLGVLVSFISEPVLVGFVHAAAVLIATTQVPYLLGVDVTRQLPFVAQLVMLGQVAGRTHAPTLVIGVVAIALLLLVPWLVDGRRAAAWRHHLARAVPLGMLLASAVAVQWLEDEGPGGVEVVGEIGLGVPPLGLPSLDLALWRQLAAPGLAIGLVAFVTSVAVAKSLAGSRRQAIDPSQELVALGAANLAASLSGGYPVGGSLSRSAVAREVGAKSSFAAAGGALMAGVAAWLLSPLIQTLPRVALAAIIITAVLGLFDLRRVRRIVRYNRADGAAMALTFLAVLLLGVEAGLVIGAFAGLALHVVRTGRPRVVLEGRVGGSEQFRSTAHEDVEEPETRPVLVLRIDQSLYFGNARYVQERALHLLAEEPSARYLLLDLKAANDIDVSALEMLEQLADDIDEAGVTLVLAEVKEPVRERLERVGFVERVGSQRLYRSVHEALEALDGD